MEEIFNISQLLNVLCVMETGQIGLDKSKQIIRLRMHHLEYEVMLVHITRKNKYSLLSEITVGDIVQTLN
jgi:hypothetical protein